MSVENRIRRSVRRKQDSDEAIKQFKKYGSLKILIRYRKAFLLNPELLTNKWLI